MLTPLTDVTGFGLLGHLRGMAAASGVSAQIWAELVPILPAARRMFRKESHPAEHMRIAGFSRAGSATIRTSPTTSSSCCATRKLLGAFSPLYPATVLHRSFENSNQRRPTLLRSSDVLTPVHPGRIRVRRAPHSGAITK